MEPRLQYTESQKPTFVIEYFDNSRSETFSDPCVALEACRKRMRSSKRPRPRYVIRVNDNARIATYPRGSESSHQSTRNIPADDVGEVAVKNPWDPESWG